MLDLQKMIMKVILNKKFVQFKNGVLASSLVVIVCTILAKDPCCLPRLHVGQLKTDVIPTLYYFYSTSAHMHKLIKKHLL